MRSRRLLRAAMSFVFRFFRRLRVRPSAAETNRSAAFEVTATVRELSAGWLFGIFAGLRVDLRDSPTSPLYGLYSLYADTTSSVSPADVPHLGGAHASVHYDGHGVVNLVDGGYFGISNRGEGVIRDARGGIFFVGNEGGGRIEDAYGIYVLRAMNDGDRMGANFGLFIEDQSGTGARASVNLYSAGAASRNVFEGSVDVKGALAASALLSRIEPPDGGHGKPLHAALEGPEIAVYYRGEAQLRDGEAVVELPPYFEAITHIDCRTIQLTPVGSWAPLYVEGPIERGRFVVRIADGNPDQAFYWEVKAVRRDLPPIEASGAIKTSTSSRPNS